MEDNSTPTPTLMSHAIRWGGITAAVSVILTMLLYAIDYTLMVQLKILFIFLAIYIGIVIYAGIDYRKSIGGFLSYGKAFQHGYLIYIISGLIATVFSMLLYFVIDPELPQKLTDASIENTREMMIGFGAPEDTIDNALEEAKEATAKQFTVTGIALGYLRILVVSAIMALISAIFVRRNQPVEIM
jgi:Mn2+/Fe2+ NRAMP family transporter